MMKRTISCLLAFILFLPAPILAADNAWKQVRSKNGIIVYMRTKPMGQWMSAKVEGIVDAPMQEILTYFYDIKKAQKITPRCDKKMILKTFSDKDRIEYLGIKLIWPFQDRYLVYRGRVAYASPNEALITASDSEDFVYKEPGKIRGKIRNGRFLFKSLNSHQTNVSIEADLHATLWLPDWIINLAARYWMLDMVRNLRQALRHNK